MEISEGTDCGDNIARLKTEDVTGPHTWSTVLARWRRSNANVETERALRLAVAGHGIVVAAARNGIAGDKIENVLILPDGGERIRNVEVAEANDVVDGDV